MEGAGKREAGDGEGEAEREEEEEEGKAAAAATEEEEEAPPDSPPFFLLYPGRGGAAAPGLQPQSAWRAAPPGPCGVPLPVLLSYIGPETGQQHRAGGARE
ncbi:Hypothetical predicted protein [Podarcis lilfordi]|uniref:Uncharacterized protein n=1 Tax=Podarcis lilfordi TaxID=74358 RepID=A0AA35KWF9_9SAUR|nr:Hypothetical predicted protein [Podarcis lilfordi]